MPSKKTAQKTPKMVRSPISTSSPELELINSLAGILNATGLTEIELDQKGVRVRVSKTVNAVAHVGHAMSAPLHTAPMAGLATAKETPVVAAAGDAAGTVKSPMVGTAYITSAPGAAPFITVGSQVKEGQTLLIIEAMKTMNQIPAPRSGKITSILFDNGQPVEFGEALLVIE
jgi:acetyl-CoA carboxylase biotin carboxyl carrier protein